MRKKFFAFLSAFTVVTAFFTPKIASYTGLSELIYNEVYNNPPNYNLSSVETYILRLKIDLVLFGTVIMLAYIFGVTGFHYHKKNRISKDIVKPITYGVILFIIFIILVTDISGITPSNPYNI